MFHDLLRTVAGRWRIADFVLPHFWGQQVVLGTQFLECQTKKAGSIWMPRWSSCWWTLPKNVFCDRELLCQVFAKMPCSCLLMPSAKGALPGTSTSSSPSLGQLITTLTCTCVFWLPDKRAADKGCEMLHCTNRLWRWLGAFTWVQYVQAGHRAVSVKCRSGCCFLCKGCWALQMVVGKAGRAGKWREGR